QNESSSNTAGAGRQFQSWKIKAERAKKVEFIRTAEKLKAQLANIEKDKTGHLYNRKSDFRVEYRLLEELEHSMTVSRKMEKAKILQQLSKIQNNVKRLQQQLKDVKPTPEFVDKIKEMMEEIENAINAFKEEQRQIYQQLLKEEKAVINELHLFERKVELWALGSPTAEKIWKLPSARVTVDKTLENHLPKEFERFLQRTGGRQGGWDDYDHQNFLKIRTKYRGRLSYMDEALEYLSGRTKEDIERHDKWYQEYVILHERKKESIKKWKEKEQQEKERNLKEKEKSEKMLKERLLQCEEAQRQKAIEERKRKQAAVEVWKKQKVVAFAIDQASQLKLEEKEKKQQKECQSHVKLLLERNTLQKKVKEELEKLENEKREETEKEGRRKIGAEEISKFQER
ncbi:CC112 protein, partial [Erythrocercus mccallii]|nr:CC112 protein [Erythrocercus mccallii]